MPATPPQERTEPADLCTASGSLNPAALGWSRRPNLRCNLTGGWPRNKRWHYWGIMGDDAFFSPAIADIDYLAFGAVYVLDFAANRLAQTAAQRLLPRKRLPLPVGVTGKAGFHARHFDLAIDDKEDQVTIAFDGRLAKLPLTARFTVTRPPEHESLNVVVPWSERRFQFTSKQVALPASGTLTWGDKNFTFAPQRTWAVLDYGRGRWPYRSVWNWAAAAGRIGPDMVGLNFGGQWTDHTGAHENGVFINGRLYPLHEDVVFTPDRTDFMRPWRVHTPGSGNVALAFTPFHDRTERINLGLIAANTHQCFGHFTGTVRVDNRPLEIGHLPGWAEECRWRW
ncbi:MAG: DUF2804 domain-containing protein [Candidatus Hydrogenedentota bacterium]